MAGSYYLTSACRTADEFVAAFRRYAEKTMLFVPTQTPLGNGTRARMAIALADGSVMIEGEIEVVGATTRAVGLHGRAGMSVRFIELDDTSRQVLDQLVRARLMSRPVPLPGHLRPRPRAGTVPEPSPELQADRARAASTVPGIGPTSNVNAEAVPAECTLQELPPAVGALGARADLESRFDYSAPAPRDLELHDAARTAATPARPMTMKGPAPVRMPVARPGAFAVPARAMPGATKPAPATALAADPTPGAEPEPAEQTRPAVETIAEETIPAAEPAPDAELVAMDDDDGAPIELDLGEPTVSEPPPSPPVPSPPKLPPQPRGRQSMSRTMLGLAPITRAPGPTSERAPAAPSEPTDASAHGGAPTAPATPGEVFGAWWPGGGTDHAETQKMEPMFPDVPAVTPLADDPRAPHAGAPHAPHTEPASPAPHANDDANDDANDGAGDEAVGALGPWPGADPARLPPPPRDLVPPVPAPVALAPAFAPTFAQPSPESGPPPVFEENTSLVGKGRRRPSRIVIASFGGALLLAVIVVVIATGGGSKSGAGGGGSDAGSGSASDSASGTAPGSTAATPAASPDAASIAAASGASLDAAAPAVSLDAGAPPAPPGAITGATCKAAFTSSPSGADVVLGGKVAGTTPRTIVVPCAAATATFKRPRYQPKDVAFTPTSDGVTVTAKLERPTFMVRITSTPAGAAVTIDGKVVGRTPLTTRQPGFENTTVTFKKDGYAPATAKLYAKANGASVKATLKKGGASHHR